MGGGGGGERHRASVCSALSLFAIARRAQSHPAAAREVVAGGGKGAERTAGKEAVVSGTVARGGAGRTRRGAKWR